MECLGDEPGAAWWKAQTNALSYGGTPYTTIFTEWKRHKKKKNKPGMDQLKI